MKELISLATLMLIPVVVLSVAYKKGKNEGRVESERQIAFLEKTLEEERNKNQET